MPVCHLLDYEYFRDTLDYYLRTRHMFMTAMFLVNEETFADLTESQQAAIARPPRRWWQNSSRRAASRSVLCGKGQGKRMTYMELTPEQLKAHAQRAREQVWPVMHEELAATS